MLANLKHEKAEEAGSDSEDEMKWHLPTTRIEGEHLDKMGMHELPSVGSHVMTVTHSRVKSAHDGDEYTPRHVELEHEHMHMEPVGGDEGDMGAKPESVRESISKAMETKKSGD